MYIFNSIYIENIETHFQNGGCTSVDRAVNKPGWWHYNWYRTRNGKMDTGYGQKWNTL